MVRFMTSFLLIQSQLQKLLYDWGFFISFLRIAVQISIFVGISCMTNRTVLIPVLYDDTEHPWKYNKRPFWPFKNHSTVFYRSWLFEHYSAENIQEQRSGCWTLKTNLVNKLKEQNSGDLKIRKVRD